MNGLPRERMLLRADADSRIGTGHVMRCLALAQAWKACVRQRGDAPHDAVHLLCGPSLPEVLRERIELEGVRVATLPAGLTPGSAAERDFTRAYAERIEAGTIVVDGYVFDADYYAGLRAPGRPLLAIDDCVTSSYYPVDVLLNQNLGASEALYPAGERRDADTRLLIGPRYVLLRDEFVSRDVPLAPRREASSVDRPMRVLITLGGSDPEGLTRRVARAMATLDTPALEALVVMGAATPPQRAQEVADEVGSRGRVVRSVPNMAEVMAWADVAITASGSTIYEAMAMGLPSLVVVAAANQRELASALFERGIGASLGEHRALDEARVATELQRLLEDPVRRRAYARAAREVVDGHGRSRVVDALHYPTLSIRPAVAADCEWLWVCANDPEMRSNSFSPEPIAWEDHVRWFDARMNDPRASIWLGIDAANERVGYVRFEPREESAADDELVVSVGVATKHRGKRYGDPLLRLAFAEEYRTRPSLMYIHGYVRLENKASHRLFADIGFEKASRVTVAGYEAYHVVATRPPELLAPVIIR